MRNVERLLLRLATPLPFLTAEDWQGVTGELAQHWQTLGVVARTPSQQPWPTCPYCAAGEPVLIGQEWHCDSCYGRVAESFRQAWPMHQDALWRHVASHLQLRGDPREIDTAFWFLGSGSHANQSIACFVNLGATLTETATRKLRSYRHTLTLHGPHTELGSSYGYTAPLADLFAADGSLCPVSLANLLRIRGSVEFDEHDGSLRVNGRWIGEVGGDTKEWHLLAILNERRNEYVSYRELKRCILERTGSRDATDEATFCHKLKSRIKRQYIPSIDRFIVTSNKGEGYRLRETVEI